MSEKQYYERLHNLGTTLNWKRFSWRTYQPRHLDSTRFVLNTHKNPSGPPTFSNSFGQGIQCRGSHTPYIVDIGYSSSAVHCQSRMNGPIFRNLTLEGMKTKLCSAKAVRKKSATTIEMWQLHQDQVKSTTGCFDRYGKTNARL